jgi:anti-sigma B factor antagonist
VQTAGVLYRRHMSDDRQVFSASRVPESSTLRLAGEVDAATAPELVEALSGLNGATETTLDLAGVTFIDSSGLHAIVAYARSREPEGTVTLTEVSPNVSRLLEITCLQDVANLRIHERA